MASEMSVECTEVITMAIDKFASSSNFEVRFRKEDGGERTGMFPREHHVTLFVVFVAE